MISKGSSFDMKDTLVQCASLCPTSLHTSMHQGESVFSCADDSERKKQFSNQCNTAVHLEQHMLMHYLTDYVKKDINCLDN